MVDEEERAAAAGDEEYMNTEDPSILRFLIASRDEASAQQLRDDLLGMLVAGHETTASVLTWTTFLLCGRPECLAKVQVCAAACCVVGCACCGTNACRAHEAEVLLLPPACGSRHACPRPLQQGLHARGRGIS